MVEAENWGRVKRHFDKINPAYCFELWFARLAEPTFKEARKFEKRLSS